MVDPATRERVCSIADSLGYKPNRAAQALVNRRTANVGIMVADPENLRCLDLVRGAQQAGRDRGLSTLIAFGDDAAELAVINDLIPYVDGIILCGSQLSDQQIADIQRLIPVVVVNRSVSGISSIAEECGIGIRCAIEYLIDCGHRRICHVSGRTDDQISRTAALVCQNSGVDFVAIVAADATFDSGITASRAVLDTRATAAVCDSDALAAGLINGLARHGIYTPSQISVVGYGDTDLARMTSPPLTTVAVPRKEVGAAALQLLHELVASSVVQNDPPSLPTHLVIRHSTGASPIDMADPAIGVTVLHRQQTTPTTEYLASSE